MLLGAAFALLIARVGNAALLASEHNPATTIAQKDAAAEQAADAEKKRSDGEDVDKYQMLQEGLASSKHLRYPDAYLEGLLQQQELMEKRASMRGFQGMRGKKSAGDYYYNEPAYYAYGAAGPPDYYYDKRAPMGFQGMRGKKSSYDADEGTGKRAPMGFQGMRGKKSLEEVLDELEKRAMMGFQGMRGKKSEADYEDEAAAAAGVANQVAPAMSEGQWQKRAPMGFQGMRGRKSSGFLEELDELDKRAILGFHGMRGKKDMGYDREELDAAAINGYGQKRPMMMGFHGMRGKRSAGLYGLSLAGLEKRSPYRFFGTRGKKNPRWEMRGKFVGVRGKKWTAGPPRPLGPAIYDEDELQALYAASILGRTAAGLAVTRH